MQQIFANMFRGIIILHELSQQEIQKNYHTSLTCLIYEIKLKNYNFSYIINIFQKLLRITDNKQILQTNFLLHFFSCSSKRFQRINFSGILILVNWIWQLLIFVFFFQFCIIPLLLWFWVFVAIINVCYNIIH